ncbi:MAG: hypothetical protein IT475_03490 [Aquimonas sp.]|jgi:cell division protein FtsL|nr:hypothetical protein [Xanthomonadales bacterium]MCC6504490.1 hypothetical protein [Aquimonas sp.]
MIDLTFFTLGSISLLAAVVMTAIGLRYAILAERRLRERRKAAAQRMTRTRSDSASVS